MDFKIVQLQDYPHFAEQCSQWDDAAWPRNPEIEDFFADHYHLAAENNGNEVPMVWVALTSDNMPIGMVSLIADDHPDYLHLSPWLASAFVLPEYRGKGVFRALHDALLDCVKTQTDYKNIHVYSHIDFSYLGNWTAIEKIQDPFENGQWVTLFTQTL